MQGILSSMMLRDYYQYSPQDLQFFKSVQYRSSRPHAHQQNNDDKKRFQKQHTTQQTAATEPNEQTKQNLDGINEESEIIEVGQFDEKYEDGLQGIEGAITLIQKQVQALRMNVQSYGQNKVDQKRNIMNKNEQEKEIPQEPHEKINDTQNILNSKSNMMSDFSFCSNRQTSLLVQYKNYFKQRSKDESKVKKFNLKNFNNKLNYSMYRHPFQPIHD